MPYVEVHASTAFLTEKMHQTITEKLVPAILVAEGAEDTIAGRDISWLTFHRHEDFVVGGSVLNEQSPGRAVINVRVPEGSLDDFKRQDIIKRVFEVLAQGSSDPKQLFDNPTVFVFIDEIRPGNWGWMGRSIGFKDIVRHIHQPPEV